MQANNYNINNNNIINNLNTNNFINNNFNNININNNIINNKKNNEIKSNDKEEIINKKILPKNVFIKGDYFISEDNKINIYFTSPLELKIRISSPPYLKINELFKNFAKKVGINEKYLNTSLMFIYNSSLLDPNDQRPITCLFNNKCFITVVEIDGINNG